MIAIKDLSFQIGSKKILHQLNFTAYPKEILTIIGPNGAGKSSLLKLISKEIAYTTGSIKLQGKELKSFRSIDLAKFRAVLPQQNYLSINLRVFDIVMMGRYPFFDFKPRGIDIEITNQALTEMGIIDLKDRPIFNLSGGEQQRVQLARVIAQIYGQDQGILLMDEPINGLDLKYQQIILEKAKKLAQKGMTVLSVLHDINLAAQYADRILLLKQGEIINLGEPASVLTEETIFDIYHTKVKRINDHALGYPAILPIS